MFPASADLFCRFNTPHALCQRFDLIGAKPLQYCIWISPFDSPDWTFPPIDWITMFMEIMELQCFGGSIGHRNGEGYTQLLLTWYKFEYLLQVASLWHSWGSSGVCSYMIVLTFQHHLVNVLNAYFQTSEAPTSQKVLTRPWNRACTSLLEAFSVLPSCLYSCYEHAKNNISFHSF